VKLTFNATNLVKAGSNQHLPPDWFKKVRKKTWRVGYSWRAGQGGRESENIRKSSKAPTAFPDPHSGVGTTLNRFSIFSESGQKHTPGCPFLLTFLDRQKSMKKKKEKKY
jgi:hypothetical protein